MTDTTLGRKGKKRTEEHKAKYRAAAARRLHKNNRPPGSYKHSEETKKKIRETNLLTYETLPEKWVKSCVENEQWFENLKSVVRPQKTEEHIRKIVESKVGMSYEEWELVRGELASYAAKVRRVTESQDLSTLEHIEKRGKGYHLDHMLSISEGFYRKIPCEVVGNIANLIMLPEKENLSKNKRSTVDSEELLKRYNDAR